MSAWTWFLTVGKEGLEVLTGMACLDDGRMGGGRMEFFILATNDTFAHVKILVSSYTSWYRRFPSTITNTRSSE